MYKPPVPKVIERWVFLSIPPLIFLLVIQFLSIAGLVLSIRTHNPLMVVASITGILIYPHAFLVWHGDAMEIHRHAAQLYLQVYLSFWLLLAAWGDRLLQSIPIAFPNVTH